VRPWPSRIETAMVRPGSIFTIHTTRTTIYIFSSARDRAAAMTAASARRRRHSAVGAGYTVKLKVFG